MARSRRSFVLALALFIAAFSSQRSQAREPQRQLLADAFAASSRVSAEPLACDASEQSLEQLFRDNLLPDLAPWKEKGLLDVANLVAYTRKLQQDQADTTKLLLMYNNTLYFPLQTGDLTTCGRPCNRYLHDLVNAFKVWGSQTQFPNTLFLMNVKDRSICIGFNNCPVPVLSLSKRIRPLPGNPKGRVPQDLDILVPKPPKRFETTAFSFPWEHKANKAVWRGSRWCFTRLGPFEQQAYTQEHIGSCARFYLGDWYMESEELRQLLDFGFTHKTRLDSLYGPGGLSKVEGPDLARFKFLLNLDGYTAAYRLSKLMLTGSVVLKEHSMRGEYYYRSMRDFVHYLPVFRHNRTDLMDVIREYQKPHRDSELRQIAQNAREFSARYCCPAARMLYWKKVLQEYRALFRGMDEAIAADFLPQLLAKIGTGTG